VGGILDLVAGFPESGKKYFPLGESIFPSPQHRFLTGNVESMIPAQRRIRIFGKRFMESEMGSILVEVLLKKLLNS